MDTRDSFTARVDVPCDRGLGLHRPIPSVTVEVQCWWPDVASDGDVLYALALAYQHARARALRKQQGT